MTYNKEKLLKMLSTAPLYEGIVFHEGKNDEFFNSIDNDFCNYYNYAYGATKLALIPLNKNDDYVIKIPYTGSYYYKSGYYTSNATYHPSETDYYDFIAADDETRPWDYCAGEAKRYILAEQEGLSKCFAKTELLGYVNNYPIYIQEKCVTFSDCKKNHLHSEEEKLKTSKCCNNYYGINRDWLTDFRLYYGEDILLKFINFIQSMQWDDDLRTENIGYIQNRPVLIDYSGFLD